MRAKHGFQTFTVCLALTLTTATSVRAQDRETHHKISPKLKAMPADQPLDVFIVLGYQPHREILQRAHQTAEARLAAAQENYRNLASQADVAQSVLERAGSDIDEAILAIRRDAGARLEAALRPGQDALERRISAFGATNVHRFTTVNMLSATIPAALLDTLEADPEVAAVFPVERQEPNLDISVPSLGAPAFWATGNSGAGQQVAILDSGIRTDHPAFKTLKIDSYVFVTAAVRSAPGGAAWQPGQPVPACVADDLSPQDQFGHGSHVAGIVASGGAPGFTTYNGVAPAVSRLINLKISVNARKLANGNPDPACNTAGTPNRVFVTTADVLQALDYALIHTAATIFNYSYGGAPGDDDYETRVFDYLADTFNVTMVISAGNSGLQGASTVGSPGFGYNSISVANVADNATVTRADDAISPTSSRGPTQPVAGFPLGRRKPDIAAPGSGVIAAGANVPNTGIFSANFNWSMPGQASFISKTGTSMAAPHIAGSVALLQNRPEANQAVVGCPAGTVPRRPLAVKALLLNASTAISPVPGVAAATPPGMKPGWDAAGGWGYADLSRTLQRLYVFDSCVTSNPAPEHARFFVGNIQVPANELFRATVTWNRHISSWQSAAGIATADIESNLSLTLYDYNANLALSPTAAQLAADDVRNNVRQVTSAANGMGVVKVRGEAGFDPGIADEQFALAVSQNGFTRAIGPQLTINCTHAPAGEVVPGSTVKVSCTVQNTGDLPVFNVVTGTSLTPVSQNQTWARALPNQSVTYTWSVVIPLSAAGEYPFTAGANGTAFGESFSVLNPFVMDVVTPLRISCNARPSVQQPTGGDFLVTCSMTNSGDVPALNTTITLSSGGPIASQNIGKMEKGSTTVKFDPISNIYSVMTGTVTWNAAGQTFSVSANVAIDPCTSYYAVSPGGASIPLSGTTAASFNVIAPAGCPWTAINSTSNPDLDEWIQFTNNGSGTGNGVISYLVLPNAGTVRTGFISIGGASFVITQAGTMLTTFTVSGRVTSPDGTGIYGVSFAGAVGSTTDANGYWTANVISGRAIKPAKGGYTFNPAIFTVTGPSSNVKFRGYFSFGISGRIIAPDGSPVPGVALTFTRQSGSGPIPASAHTDAQGQWHQIGFQTGTTYLITPSAVGFGFSPANRTASDGAIGLDFTGLPQAAVSGRVVSSTTGAGVAGVTMTFLLVSGSTGVPAAVQTDAQGNYSQTGFVVGTSYLVTPAKAGFNFTPSSLAFVGSSSGLNFSGAPVPFSITGRVTDSSGAGSSGVTLTFVRSTGSGGAPASVQTDPTGNYSQANFDTGSTYQVSPSKPGLAFTPVSRSFSDGSTPLNFSVVQPLNVSGKIVDGNGNGFPGITLTFTVSGSATPPAPVQTDAAGNWQQTGFLPGFTWTITPAKPGYTFIPPSANFTASTPNLVFTGYVPASASRQLINTNGVPIAGATLTFTPGNKLLTAPASVATDSTGHWSETGLAANAAYAVTFSLAGVTFSPASNSIIVGTGSILLMSTATFTASGVVTATQGNGFPNVPVTFTSASTAPAQVLSNSSGAWSQSGFLLGTVYQAQAYKVGCGTPPALTFSGPSTTLNFSIIVCNR